MVSFVWSFIFTGAIPNLAKILHVDALANISWFGNAGTAAFTVILVTTWQSTGFLMMLYITGLQTIQKDVLKQLFWMDVQELRKLFISNCHC